MVELVARTLAVLLLLTAGTVEGREPLLARRAAVAKLASVLMDPTTPLPWRATGLSSLSRLPAWSDLGVSENCTNDLAVLERSFKNGSIWAIQMFDASTKIPDGVLNGNLVHMGNFDECLSVQHGDSGGPPGFDGQHCLVSLALKDSGEETMDVMDDWQALAFAAEAGHLHLARTLQWRADKKDPDSGDLVKLFGAFSLRIAWCTPSTCTPQDLEKIAAAAVDFTALNITTSVLPSECHTHVGKKLRGIDIFAIYIFVLFVALAAASTAYDIITLQRAQRRPLLLAFSVYSNWPKLIAVTKPGPDQLPCLHGIRTLSMCWVILCHVYVMDASMPTVNLFSFSRDFIPSFNRLLITNGTLSVDSFFLMSGLLLSFLFLREVERTNRFNVVKFYVHRYVRLTPALAILIFFTVTLMGYAGSGPLWDSSHDYLRQTCEKNWWTNLLYINNYVHSDNMCLGHTWYLATDMQLYWLSPLVLLPLWKLPKRKALLWVSFLLLVGWIVPFTIVYLKELSPSFVAGDINQRMDTFTYYYWPAHTRYVPWLIGVVLGYILHEARKKKPELPPWAKTLGWAISSVLTAIALNAAYPFQQTTWVYNRVQAAFWLSLFRAMWAVGLGWIIFASDQGHGGLAHMVLTWKFFQPLGRLCYGIYLLHLPILQLFAGVVQSPMYLADVTIIPQIFGVFLMSVAWAIPLVLLFESPIILIEKSIFAGTPWRLSEPQDDYHNMDNDGADKGDESHA